jgi:hypothetical protein
MPTAHEPDDGYDTLARWVNHPFWFRHPGFAWLLELALVAPVFFFVIFCVFSGNDNAHALGFAICVAFERLFKMLKKRSIAQRLPRPSPFFFWC